MIIIDIIDDTDAKTEKPRRTTPAEAELTGRGLLALLRKLNGKKLPAPEGNEHTAAGSRQQQTSTFPLQQHTEDKPPRQAADE